MPVTTIARPSPQRHTGASRRLRARAIGAVAGVLALGLTDCSERTTLVERIQARGELIVATRNSPTTYYEGPQGPMGLEYELANRFAHELGVKLTLRVVPSNAEAIAMVAEGGADLAAAGLTITRGAKNMVRFGPTYQKITQQVVYRSGSRRPRSGADLVGRHIEVVAGSSHEERLRDLKTKYPRLEWTANSAADREELLRLVAEQLVSYTVADSHELAINRRYYPELRSAFDLTKPQPLAWALARDADDSLYQRTTAFFGQMKKSRTLAQLIDRYYGHVERLGEVGNRTYLSHILLRLPGLRPWFEKAAQRHGVDWRLLAAVGYQESHWKEDAVSPTGVRGIMMLTNQTARHLGVADREDPVQSIHGGARYLAQIEAQIDEDVAEPDRTWLALAAYNLGYGHLLDAQRLTRSQGDDPRTWLSVKKRLPLLNQEKWYRRTRHGYANGRNAVSYVERIRSYYDVLVWFSDAEKRPSPRVSRALLVASPAL